MAIIWYPDICVKLDEDLTDASKELFCKLQMGDDGLPEQIIKPCSHHAALGLNDAQLMSLLLNTCRAKEYSRAAAAEAIGWDTHVKGPLPWVLRNDGAVILKTGTTGQELIDAQAAVAVVMQNYPDVTLIVE